MDSIGARLKDIRLKKGLSLEEAHAQTKINANILKAIEEDNLANVSPVYIKGFIKIYCDFLGLDPKDFMPDQKQHQPAAPAAQPKAQPAKRAQAKEATAAPLRVKIDPIIWKALGAGVVIGLLIFGFKNIHLGGKKLRPAQVPEAQQKTKIPLPKPPKKTVQKLKPAPESPAKTVQAGASVAQKQGSAGMAQPAKAEAISGIRLSIHAQEDCWVQLKIDGKAVFQSVLRKGRYEVWQANDRMELSLGNVGGVELELNGKMLQPLGRRGQSLKNIIITKDGLKVER